MAKRFTYGVNLAPLIDVVFILLAFMLIYSRLDITETIEVNLPQAEGQTAEIEHPVMISIGRNGEFFWGKDLLSEEDLRSRTAVLTPEQSVLVQADREAASESLITVISILSQAGIHSANIKVAGKSVRGS